MEEEEEEEWSRLDALARRMAASPVAAAGGGGGGVTPRDRWTFGGWNAPLRVEHVCVSGTEVVDWLVNPISRTFTPKPLALNSKPFILNPDALHS